MNSSRWINLLKMVILAVGLVCLYEAMEDGQPKFHGVDDQVTVSGDNVNTIYDFAMGTSVSVSTYGGAVSDGRQIADSIKYLDEKIISWRETDSELFELNSSYEKGIYYEISNVLYTAIFEGFNICKDSGGALDITIRPLADVWNIEGTGISDFVVPDEDCIENALENVGYENIMLISDNELNNNINISKDNLVIDLGALGKGYALDYVKPLLDSSEITGAVICVGGSVMVYGSKTDGSRFKIGVRNPKGDMDDMIGYLELPAGSTMCISTSGDYEKYIMHDGKKYHHILDRNTGYPADSGLSAVTVVCQNGLYSDALSTACFVLGYEKALELLDKYDAQAVFIDKDNKITITDGLSDVFVEDK